jgi:CRP-like cAMP-binding protein
VGELSVLTEAGVRESDAVCIRDCELVCISSAAFDRITSLFPKVMRRFSQLLAKRHQEVRRRCRVCLW